MKRFLSAFALIALISNIAYSQVNDRPDYKLLWKVSGQGLKKPSYLFGTMHVRDNMAFDFSDSVLLKIDACDAFAMEIHPDSLGKEIMSMVLDLASKKKGEFDNGTADPEYQYLDSLMKARTGSSLQRFGTSREASIFLFQQFGKKDRNTFLDTWLYNIARNQNKVILGLEQVEDQRALLEGNPESELQSLKQNLEQDYDKLNDWYQLLLDEYHKGDINALRKISKQQQSPEQYDAIITKRNSSMTLSIIKAMHQQSTFIAVGAAHLPGDEGIINLLRMKGYTVTLVKPSFTGLAAKYQPVSTEQKWVTFTQSRAGYRVDMPKSPVALSITALPEDMQMALDLGTLSIFMSTHLPLPANMKNKPTEDLLNTLVTTFSNKGPVSNAKTLKVAECEAFELEMDAAEQYFRIRYILRDPMLYVLMVGPTKEMTNGDEAKRFFESFKVLPLTVPASSYKPFQHDEGAFSVRVPGKITTQQTTPSEPESGKQYKINVFYSTDGQTGESFIFRYNDFPAGLVSSNDSLYLRLTLQKIVDNIRGTNLNVTDTTYSEFPCLKFDFDATQQGMRVTGLSVMRGNRYYLFFSMRPVAQSDQYSQEYLRSITFLPYQKKSTRWLDLEDAVSMKVPEHFERDSSIQITDEWKRYSFMDTYSGMQYLVQFEELSQYQQANSMTEYFDLLEKGLREDGDSVIMRKEMNDQYSYEYQVRSSQINVLRQIRFSVADKKLISLWAYIPVDYKQSSLSAEILDSFTVKPKTSWNLMSDKTDLILEDILSPDSLRQAEASQAISEHLFKTTDLPKIYVALKPHYPDDNYEYGGTRRSLLNVLNDQHDASTIPFIEELYSTLPDSTSVRDNALNVLSSMNTVSAAKSMMALMRLDAPRKLAGYEVLGAFYDSLELLNSIVSELIELEPRFDGTYTLYNLVRMALDSNVLQPQVKQQVIKQVEALGNRLLNEPRIGRNDDEYYNQHERWVNLANLLGALPFTPEVKGIVLNLHQLHDPEIMLSTIMLLLKNKVNVTPADFNIVSEQPAYRLQLYFELKAIGEEKCISKKHLSPRMIAESDLYDYLSYDDGIPDSMMLIMQKTVTFNGKEQHIFLFKYNFEGYDGWTTALSGPFLPKLKSGAIQRGDWTASFYEDYENDELLLTKVNAYIEEQGGVLNK